MNENKTTACVSTHRGGGARDGKVEGLLLRSARHVRPSSGTAAASAAFPTTSVIMTMMMTTNEIVPDERWRPVAYVTMQDKAARAAIETVLERSGWAVIPQPTGFHLIQAISGVIEGHQTWLRPSLIVIDARPKSRSGASAEVTRASMASPSSKTGSARGCS